MLTPDVIMWILSGVCSVLFLGSVWGIKEIITLGKTSALQAQELATLGQRIAAAEAVAKERKEEVERRLRDHNDQIRDSLRSLEKSLDHSMERVEGKVVALHERLDRVLEKEAG